MPPPLIQLADIALTFGGTPLLEGVELSVSAGERVCLVGRNGSGKSTLLKIVAGLVEPDSGERFIQPGAAVRYLPQEPDLSGFASTLAFVESGLGPTDDPHQARYLLEQLGLTGDEDPARISGGEARRAALAHVLAPDPDILLLDEPTNHLDLPAIEWLEAHLAQHKAALVLISHDRRFLENLSRITVWLDRGKTSRVDLGFSQFEAWRDQKLEEEEVAQHKLDRKIAREEHWMRYGVTARRKRNVRRVAGLQALRQTRRDYRRAEGKAEIVATEAETSGTLVIEAKGVGKSFGERAIVKDLSVRVMRGDRIGVVGPNGSGKTTLVRALLGHLPLEQGSAELDGKPVSEWRRAQLARVVGVVAQREEVVFPLTVTQTVMLGRYPHLGPLSPIGFHDREATLKALRRCDIEALAARRVDTLSGGEWQRVRVARALAQQPRVLVLDEPTSSLDVRHRMEVFELVRTLVADGLAGLVVTHELNLAARFADRVVLLNGGKVVADGTPAEVFQRDILSDVFQWPVAVTTFLDGSPQVIPLRVGEEAAEAPKR